MYSTKPLIDSLGGLWNGDIFTEHRHYPIGRYGDHSLPGYSINLTLAGYCRFGSKKGPNFVASAGDIVFVEPRKLHLWEVVPDPSGRTKDRPWHVLFCGFI